jgi:hypothetical protein
MKLITLIAVIATVIGTIVSFYNMLIDFNILDIEYDTDINKLISLLVVLSRVGLMVFFIQLYNKQPKN